jgi:hypothetical protein
VLDKSPLAQPIWLGFFVFNLRCFLSVCDGSQPISIYSLNIKGGKKALVMTELKRLQNIKTSRYFGKSPAKYTLSKIIGGPQDVKPYIDTKNWFNIHTAPKVEKGKVE